MTQVFVLGAGTPTPTPDRWGSAFAVDVGGEYLMFECGPAATAKLVKVGILPTRVDYLFFTHHHFDHDVDYPCFLLCRWDQSIGKENQLRVYGPTLTETITERLLGENGAFVHDWKARVNAPLSQRVHVNRGGTLPRRPPVVLAQEAGVRRLALVHVGPHLARHGPMEKGIGDIRRIYRGEVIVTDELMSLSL